MTEVTIADGVEQFSPLLSLKNMRLSQVGLRMGLFLRKAPDQRYQAANRVQRSVRIQSVAEFFYRREPRTVDEDHVDVRVGNQHFAVDPNLLRCFHCETNFNPIDFTMAARECDFVEAVHYLLRVQESLPHK